MKVFYDSPDCENQAMDLLFVFPFICIIRVMYTQMKCVVVRPTPTPGAR